jgi:hypothetical protein
MNHVLKEQLTHTPTGNYLTIYGDWSDQDDDAEHRIGNHKRDQASTHTLSHTVLYGELKAVNWDEDTVMLHSTVYDTDTTVDMNKAFRIDDARGGSDATVSPSPPDCRHDRMVNWYPRV